MDWPNKHKFAFTIVDDTDSATITNVKPVYDLLFHLGMRTTKTAWIFRGDNPKKGCGSTCEENDYLQWLLSLQRRGFELGFHNAAPCTSSRRVTEQALLRFRQLFGERDLLSCNHMGCRENIYWGPARVSGLNRLVYHLATKGKQRNVFRGEIEVDPLFWGDLCQRYVRYVRNFVFEDLDALAVCPEHPYHDSAKPFVNFWFTSTDGGTVTRFLKNFSFEKFRRLEAGGGMCIAYVHFGSLSQVWTVGLCRRLKCWITFAREPQPKSARFAPDACASSRENGCG